MGSVGIGPQGGDTVLRHSAQAWGTILFDSDGPEGLQVTLKRNSENFQKRIYLKKMMIFQVNTQLDLRI